MTALDTLQRVETPEGIELELRAAGFVARAYAALIDVAIRLALLAVASFTLLWMGRMGWGAFLIAMFVLEWGYPVAFEVWRGATPGKQAMALRVAMDNGMPVTLAASLLRNLLRVVDLLPIAYGAGLVTMHLRADFKRLGDVVAGTLVLHTATPRTDRQFTAAQPEAAGMALTGPQQAAILNWAFRAASLTPERADELATLALPALRAGAPGDTPSARLARVAASLK